MIYSSNTMDTTGYLHRIGYSGQLLPDFETLRRLHRAHLFSVPFENLDIHLGRPIQLEYTALFDKLVSQRRGGFCYELNGLFGKLLEQIGFGVTLLNARCVNDDGSYGIEFDHLALMVTCPEKPEEHWLADVGFGGGPLEPVRLVENAEQLQGDRLFKLVHEAVYQVLIEQVTRADGRRDWIKHYAFTLNPQVYADFFPGCHYHSTSPHSMFTQKRLCTLFLPDGRATLSDSHLILTRSGKREERELDGENEIRKALREIFAIVL
jgi:N-hydroxyarylamine O-acetyltransferase